MSSERRKKIAMDVEVALGSAGRLRILKFLVKNPGGEAALTRYKLKVLTGLKTKDVNEHLKILVEKGWIKEIPLNGVKKYRLDLENRNVGFLEDFFYKLDYVG